MNAVNLRNDKRSDAPVHYYYWATALFLLLDYFAGINIRLASLEGVATWRAAYYLFCIACLGLMLWRPAWTNWVATGESLLTLSLLIISLGMRAMTLSDTALTSGSGFVSGEELINFILSGSVAWIAYMRGARAIQAELRRNL